MNEEQQFEALEADFEALESEDLDLAGFGGNEFEELGALGEELEEAAFDELGADEATSFESLTAEGEEGQADVAFIGWFAKRKVKRILRKLIRLARKYRRIRRCRHCVRLLVATIRLARTGRWLAALRYAFKTYRCFRRCLRR